MGVHIAGSPSDVIRTTVTVGTTAVQALHANKARAGYRCIADDANVDNIVHGHNSLVTTSDEDVLAPGDILEDVGNWDTIYRGEVWFISGTAAQSVVIEEIVKVA